MSDDLRWFRDQVFALCEDTEERYAAIAERDQEGKLGAFARGRIIEAKSIRRTIGEMVSGRLRFAEPAGTPSSEEKPLENQVGPEGLEPPTRPL